MPNQSSTTGRAIQRLSLIVGSIAVVPVSIAAGNQAYIGGLVGVVDSTFVSGYNIDTKGGLLIASSGVMIFQFTSILL